MQIEQFALEQAKEVFNHSVVQTVALATHTLADTLGLEHPLVLLVLVLPSLIGVKNQFGIVWYLCKGFFQHVGRHGQRGTVDALAMF